MSLLKTLTRLTLINVLTRVNDRQYRQNRGEIAGNRPLMNEAWGVLIPCIVVASEKRVRGKEMTSKIRLCCLDKRVGGKFQMEKKKKEKRTMLFRNETD